MFAALACCFFVQGALASTVVTVGGQDYRVDTITGTFDDNAALLQSQVWWSDYVLSREFAQTVGGALGYPIYDGVYSPGFANSYYTSSGGDPTVGGWTTYFGHGGIVGFGRLASEEHTFAVATLVPIPAAVWLFGSALAGLALRRKAS